MTSVIVNSDSSNNKHSKIIVLHKVVLRSLSWVNIRDSFFEASPRRLLKKLFDTRENREFLPAHLEILETPPTPYAMGLCWIMISAFIGVITWCFVANLDIHAIAGGRVQPSGRSKVIQAYEISKVQKIYVTNGKHVSTGDSLVDMEHIEANAELVSKKGDLDSLESQIIRRNAVVNSVRNNEKVPSVDFDDKINKSISIREREVMVSEIRQYFATKDSLQSQLEEKIATQDRLSSSLEARNRLISVLRERANMREILVQKSAGTRAAVLDALQQVEQVAADIAYDQGQLMEAKAAEKSIKKRIEQLIEDTISKQQEYLSDAFQRRDVLLQEVIKANVRKDRLKIVAPLSGTIQQVTVNTVGQVVTAGQPLMVIVPDDAQLEVEAQVLNKDIGFISVGQRAVVKIDAFPYVKYGTLEGKVVQVSQDSVADKDAMNAGDVISSASGRSLSQSSGTFNTQNLIYPVVVKLDKDYIDVDGRQMKINAGMTVTVEIHTGQRSVMEYVLSPVRQTTSTAAHER